MTTEIKMICRVYKAPDVRLDATTHDDGTVSIHSYRIDAILQCSLAQAKDLVEKLQVAIAELEGEERGV